MWQSPCQIRWAALQPCACFCGRRCLCKPRVHLPLSLLPHGQEEEEESKTRRFSAPWAYARSLAWLRPMLMLAALYVAALSLILLLFSQLPTPSQLAGALPPCLHARPDGAGWCSVLCAGWVAVIGGLAGWLAGRHAAGLQHGTRLIGAWLLTDFCLAARPPARLLARRREGHDGCGRRRHARAAAPRGAAQL